MKTRMKKLLALICVSFCMFAYAETKGSKTFRSFMSEADTVVVSANSVTFTDDSGRTEPLTIAKRPKKVAVLYSSYAALWMECGGTVSVGVGGKTTVEFYNEQVGRDITLDEGFIHGNQVCNILRIKRGFMSAFNIMDLSDDLLSVFCL